MNYAISTISKFAAIFLVVAAVVSAGTVVSLLKSTPQTAKAATVDYFLKIDGLSGSASASNHKGEIEISSFSWGATNSSTIGSQSSGAGAGKVSMNSFSITKQIDVSSPKLFTAAQAGGGKKLGTVVFTVVNPNTGSDWFQLTLSNAIVGSYGISSGGDRPTESLSLNFTKIEFKYLGQ